MLRPYSDGRHVGFSSRSATLLAGVQRRTLPNYYNYSRRRPVHRSDYSQSIHSRASDIGSYGNYRACGSVAEAEFEAGIGRGAEDFDSDGADGDMMQSWSLYRH